MYIRKDIELEFIMINCQKVGCIRLGVYVRNVRRPPSNASEDNYHLSQFVLNFSVDRKVILIGDFNLYSINWDNVHPFEGDFKLTTQAFVDAFVSSGLTH